MPKKKITRVKPKIQRQDVLAETGRRGYEMLRLSRVKYAENPYTFIDLRLFQRGWDEIGSNEVYHPTQEGYPVKGRSVSTSHWQMDAGSFASVSPGHPKKSVSRATKRGV